MSRGPVSCFLPRLSLGVPQSGYPVIRNILGSVPSWLRVARPIDPCRIVSGIRYRATGKLHFDELFRFREPYLPRVDLLHFFNSVASTTTPWITTFEHCMPRWDRSDGKTDSSAYQRGANLMASNSCRGLLAFSDATRNVVRNEWRDRLDRGLASTLESKVETLLPPQSVVIEISQKPALERPLLAFVGADFYRKGGLETLGALDRLHQRGLRDWRAVVVGRLSSFGDYASATDASSQERACVLLSRLQGWVQHFERIGPQQVLELLCRSTYYLFPTFADTFGYSALEAMACGSVVITTNVRAMSEVVDGSVGYSIPLPLDQNRDAHTLPGFKESKAMLEHELERTIESALSATSAQRTALATAATARLRQRHDPVSHQAAMDRIYRGALGL
jgi:glycosyltransferase involved in cell wall biosynthesis